MNGYEYEYEWDSKYCYPNSFVLKNKLGIRDGQLLTDAEREITAVKIAGIKDKPIRGKLDFKHLKGIHRKIFSDIFPWAGNSRTVDISKGNQFCLCQHIDEYAHNIFSELRKEQFLSGKTETEMSERLTHYLSEINVLHPFREGNGRTQRVFIEYLAQCAGYYVDFSQVDGKEMIEASALSFACDYGMMNDMFKRILSPTTPQEQEIFRKMIGLDSKDNERG